MELRNRQKRLWAEIDLDKVERNFRLIDGNVCCVVKADAYGHGACVLAKYYEELGAMYFAVSNIEEAIQLRKHGITKPVLVLGYTPVECASVLAKYDIEQTVYSYEYAVSLNKEAVLSDVKIRIHIKIDTGMGRIGFQYHDNHNELELAYKSCLLSNLVPQGIFTHFAIADEGINEFTSMQYNYFSQSIELLKKHGVSFKIHHCSNSAATLLYPGFRMDMVRAGIILYGLAINDKQLGFQPVLTLKSVVSNVKTIYKGDSVSYGRTFVAKKDMKIATIPVGYADGFYRSNTGSYVFLNNKKCQIVGRVCMDQLMVVVDDASIGDEVEIYGPHITVDDVAKYNNTIPYEVLCSIAERVPRVYIKDGRIVEIVDKLSR
jgi:alanine racemase